MQAPDQVFRQAEAIAEGAHPTPSLVDFAKAVMETISMLKVETQAEWDMGYTEGYQDGMEQGSAEGYDRGRDDGLAENE